MLKVLGLSLFFFAGTIYYGLHCVEKIKEAVTIYRNGPLDKQNGNED